MRKDRSTRMPAKPRKRFVVGDSSTEALQYEIERAMREYPSLLRVVQFKYDPKQPPEDADLLHLYGFGDYQQLTFEIGEGGHRLAGGGGNLGGFTYFLRNKRGVDRTAIFLRQSNHSPDHMAIINLGIFFHELGHVDDFEKQKFTFPGKSMDVVNAELHAHAFACKRLFEGNYLLSLSFWLASLEYCLARCGVPNVEQAAIAMMNAPEYKRYREPMNGAVEDWKHLIGGRDESGTDD